MLGQEGLLVESRRFWNALGLSLNHLTANLGRSLVELGCLGMIICSNQNLGHALTDRLWIAHVRAVQQSWFDEGQLAWHILIDHLYVIVDLFHLHRESEGDSFIFPVGYHVQLSATLGNNLATDGQSTANVLLFELPWLLDISQHLLHLAILIFISFFPGVDDWDLKYSFPGVETHDNLNGLIRCEFQRVFDQIYQYLLQSYLITYESLRYLSIVWVAFVDQESGVQGIFCVSLFCDECEIELLNFHLWLEHFFDKLVCFSGPKNLLFRDKFIPRDQLNV